MRRPVVISSITMAVALLAGAVLAAGEKPPDLTRLPAPAAVKVDYARDVQPILAARCYACHGGARQQGGLRLHRKVDALAGGDGGLAIVPGKSAESRLIHFVAGITDKVMPPSGPRLTPQQVGILRAWIDQGAPWPDADQAGSGSTHWAFQPVKHPAPPKVKTKGWVRNPVDAFVLQKLEAKGLRPSPEADPVTLIRRVSLDLTGLPPTPEEVDQFLNDRRPGAYERLVDRLLASPHYGEKWARHWLDLARYADSNGYSIDGPRTMWMYRDWVIDALNRDMPFDEFTVEQLAGDLLPHPTESQIIATGFHRNTLLNEEGGTDPEQFRVESVVDRANTTGAVWLGLTVGCAQCHSHKFDPITQREYYQLFAFFNNQDEPTRSFLTPEQKSKQAAMNAEIAGARKELAVFDRTHPAGDAGRAPLASRLKTLQDREKEFQRGLPTAMVLQERAAPRDSFVLLRGDFLRHGRPVHPDVPSVLPALQTGGRTTNRLDLARWLVDPKNPLTPRVTVNRFWQHLFGRGLVETENDFGTQGTPPTHPELLDWLASYFVAGVGPSALGVGENASSPHTQNAQRSTPNAHPWSPKQLLRLLVTSATYRQSSRYRADLAKADPRNTLLGRQNRLRLDAELIRDAALQSSGMLCPKIGGPSVFPPQPGGTDILTQVKRPWKVSEGEDRYRRGMYTWHWRSNPYPLFATLDAPNANTTCTRRARADTPTQSLMLANDASLFELAQGLAVKTLKEGGTTDEDRVRFAFRRALSRLPQPSEAARLLRYYQAQVQRFQAAPADTESVAPKERPAGVRAAEAAGWTALARVLMNLDEFITRE